jgi:limonene-1,2-epoxide hydrolase
VVAVTRLPLFAALAASLLALPALAEPQPSSVDPLIVQAPGDGPAVARAFLAAARSDDRPAVIRLLDEQVSVRYPDQAAGMGEAEGRAFAIGYLDGLFHGARSVHLDGVPAAGAGGAVRVLAHEVRSRDRYAIDLDIRGAHVVGLTVSRASPVQREASVAAPIKG